MAFTNAFDIDIIHNIFENVNIYRSIVLYNNKNTDEALRIADKLTQHDYPVKVYTPNTLAHYRVDAAERDQTNFRMFFIPFDELLYFFELWDKDVNDINFIMFLGKDVKIKYDQIALTVMSKFITNASNLITYVISTDCGYY
jgi:hypothetical protein